MKNEQQSNQQNEQQPNQSNIETTPQPQKLPWWWSLLILFGVTVVWKFFAVFVF